MIRLPMTSFFFFFNDTATTEIYTLSLHDALPIWIDQRNLLQMRLRHFPRRHFFLADHRGQISSSHKADLDRKSTRLNSSHLVISYAVFCLKKKKKQKISPLHSRASLYRHIAIRCD